MPTPLSTHRTNRAAAGAAYAAAAAAYVAAWIELHAYDQVAANANLGGTSQPSFAAQPQIAGHPEFLRDIPGICQDMAGRARTRANQLITS